MYECLGGSFSVVVVPGSPVVGIMRSVVCCTGMVGLERRADIVGLLWSCCLH